MTTTSNHSFNPDYFENTWNDYSTEDYDVVIIGGGSVGAGAAVDAATRGLKTAVLEVSEYLGNTPTIAKNSYIDPRVIDLYEHGTTIDPAVVAKRYRSPAAKQRAIEAAVLEMLS